MCRKGLLTSTHVQPGRNSSDQPTAEGFRFRFHIQEKVGTLGLLLAHGPTRLPHSALTFLTRCFVGMIN